MRLCLFWLKSRRQNVINGTSVTLMPSGNTKPNKKVKKNILIFLGAIIALIAIVELAISLLGGNNIPDLDEQLYEIISKNEDLSKQMGTFRASDVEVSNFVNIEKDTITFNVVFSGSNAKLFFKGKMKKNEAEWEILSLFMIKNSDDSISIPVP